MKAIEILAAFGTPAQRGGTNTFTERLKVTGIWKMRERWVEVCAT